MGHSIPTKMDLLNPKFQFARKLFQILALIRTPKSQKCLGCIQLTDSLAKLMNFWLLNNYSQRYSPQYSHLFMVNWIFRHQTFSSDPLQGRCRNQQTRAGAKFSKPGIQLSKNKHTTVSYIWAVTKYSVRIEFGPAGPNISDIFGPAWPFYTRLNISGNFSSS